MSPNSNLSDKIEDNFPSKVSFACWEQLSVVYYSDTATLQQGLCKCLPEGGAF